MRRGPTQAIIYVISCWSMLYYQTEMVSRGVPQMAGPGVHAPGRCGWGGECAAVVGPARVYASRAAQAPAYRARTSHSRLRATFSDSQVPHYTAWVNCLRGALNAVLTWVSLVLCVLVWTVDMGSKGEHVCRLPLPPAPYGNDV